MWINGPQFLREDKNINIHKEFYLLVNPEKDTEVRVNITCAKTSVTSQTLGYSRFSRFSEWASLVRAITCIKRSLQKRTSSSESFKQFLTKEEIERMIIQQVQIGSFRAEIDAIQNGRSAPKDSSLQQLNPFLDEHGQ